MKKKTLFIIILIVVMFCIAILLIINFTKKVDPRDIIKDRFGLSLPATSEIINYDYFRDDDSLYAKIQIDKRNVKNVKNDLNRFFGHEYIIHNIRQIPNCENSVAWWDMDKEKVKDCYSMLRDGKPNIFGFAHETIEIWAFIVKLNDETYYLYIAS